MAIELTNDSLSEGSLNSVSYFRPAKLFTAHESLMSRTVARLKPEVFNRLLDTTMDILDRNRMRQ
jgi:mRNA interferase MazF